MTADISNLDDWIQFHDSEVNETVKNLALRYATRTPDVLCGRNRMVFVFTNYVVKIPMNWDGVADNDWEGSVSNGENYGDPQYVQYARTRLVYVGDIAIVFMECVRHASVREVEEHLGTPPGESDWTWSVDGGQVGFNRHGRLVAYDYGCR
jgi:hypothetical protein